jgi:hypothetical protein
MTLEKGETMQAIAPTPNPAEKLADAELHFIDGELDGLKLIGFAVWPQRGTGRKSRSRRGSTPSM